MGAEPSLHAETAGRPILPPVGVVLGGPVAAQRVSRDSPMPSYVSMVR